MHDSGLAPNEYRTYVDMLRVLLSRRTVSGHMLVRDFLDDCPRALTEANYAEAEIQGFHQFLAGLFNQAASTQHTTTSSTRPSPPPTPTQTTDPTQKETWQQLMRPLAAKFASERLSTDAILEFIWQALTDNGSLDALYTMGKALLRKSAE